MSELSYKDYDGLGLAELVKKKEIHPRELVEKAINRIEVLNPQLNAVINKMYDQARITAEKDLNGTFAGVPMLLKDITQEVAGEPITSGSKAFKGYRAKQDSEYVRKLRNAGVIFLGQTNVPELALMGITEPAYYGPTRNPWSLNHTPGGSSGGSAAAVASGMVPIAGANDGGGSIRIPSAYCGLFGLKPTRGRTPVGPRYGRHWQGASVDHILSRSVRDSAAMLDELIMYEKASAYHAPPFQGSYLQMLKKPLKKQLKIAFSVKSPLDTDVHSECKKVVIKAAKSLESMGHIVEEKDAPVDGTKIAKSYITMYFGEVAAALAELEELIGRKAKPNDVEPTTWLLSLLGEATSAKDFVLSIREWDKAAYAMENFHETYDLYLTPTTAFPPAKIGELEPSSFEKLTIAVVGKLGLGGLLKKTGIVDKIAETSLMRTPFTQLANLTGQPAMTLPFHQTQDGLPVGAHFMTGRGREDLLFQIAALMEQTQDWIDIRKNSLFAIDV
ncbi:amidase family protein [Desulfotruncus alcoholivorax]|uniref:amidase family protein n=1 Tax=Desulfotruncus alcoholivorax TaxID=265477 RepID=UPI000400DE3D|nr:amidase family protein [Desulfotruncus alcoholivorax]